MRKLENRAWPWDLQRTVQANKRLKLEICPSERALLNFLIARLHNLDADVLVGHNIAAYDMGVLLQRIQACKILHWSKVGRMRMRTMPKLGGTSAYAGNTFAQVAIAPDLVRSRPISPDLTAPPPTALTSSPPPPTLPVRSGRSSRAD